MGERLMSASDTPPPVASETGGHFGFGFPALKKESLDS